MHPLKTPSPEELFAVIAVELTAERFGTQRMRGSERLSGGVTIGT